MYKIIANIGRALPARFTVTAANEHDARIKGRMLLAAAGYTVRTLAVMPGECL